MILSKENFVCTGNVDCRPFSQSNGPQPHREPLESNSTHSCHHSLSVSPFAQLESLVDQVAICCFHFLFEHPNLWTLGYHQTISSNHMWFLTPILIFQYLLSPTRLLARHSRFSNFLTQVEVEYFECCHRTCRPICNLACLRCFL